jgi:hypothetical protein
MNAPNARRVPSVLAGVLAMAASMTALATVVVSDFAEAAERPEVMLSDDLTPQAPVKVAKIEHKVIDEPTFDEILEMPVQKKIGKKRRLDFGAFEGY